MITISKFKATCHEVLERVRRTKRPVLVTRFGKPVAEVVPPRTGNISLNRRPTRWIGSMAGTGRIVGDIVCPATDERDWNVLRDR